ncbi:MAG: hypothetical protein ACK481_01235 [Candidatus Melainabacteria bacterium]|jgi:hypothetical protein
MKFQGKVGELTLKNRNGNNIPVSIIKITHDETLYTFAPGDFVDTTRKLAKSGIFPRNFGKA